MAMLGEEVAPRWCKSDYVAAICSAEGDEAAVVGVFPHGELGTGRAPSIHRLFVGPVASCEPFKEIEDEVLDDDVGHGVFARFIIYRGCRVR